jgi:hypothetical protein
MDAAVEFVGKSTYISKDSGQFYGEKEKHVKMWILVCLMCSALAQAPAQYGGKLPEDTLATVGSSVITARDFLERLELMPWPGIDRRQEHDSAKIRALRSLVAEKLLAQEAAVRGIGQDTISRRRVADLERLMVRDELFKREVIGRIQVTDRELGTGMKRYTRELRLLYLHAPSEETARELRDSVRRGGVVDSMLHLLSPRLLFQVDTLLLSYGSIDPVLEDSAYALTSRRRLSGVMRSEIYGWGLVWFLSEHLYSEAVEKSVPDRIHAVRNTIRARKQQELARRYSGSVLSPQRAEANPEMFERFASILHAIMVADSQSHVTRGGYRLGTVDLDALEKKLGDDLDRELVAIPNGSLSVRDVIAEFRFQEFAFRSLDPELFRNRLNVMIKDMVAAALLAREGYRQKLQNTTAVRHDVSVWDDYWSASALMRSLQEGVTVSDEEVMASLVARVRSFGRAYEVNVREVLAESLATVLQALDRVNKGEPLADVARALSRRTEWARRGGESGFFRVDSLPELGVAALWTDSGAYGGPLSLREGFSVFQVLGKRVAVRDSVPPPDSLKAVSRRLVRAERQNKAVQNAVGELARKAGVYIDEKKLRALYVNPSNMVTRRYVGFGGVITAVPSIFPLWQWGGDRPPQDQVP